MKTRVISAAMMAIICVPFLILGGLYFAILIALIGLLGVHEFINVRESKKSLPVVVKILSYISVLLLIFNHYTDSSLTYVFDYRIIFIVLMILLIPIVIYYHDNKYNIMDACYLVGMILLLGVGCNLLIIIRNMDIMYIIYLLTISVITDTYAYFAGRLIGKHNLTMISPKKTIEGTIVGLIVGTIVGTLYYFLVVDGSSLIITVVMTLFLSIISQLGDLAFSAIKRYYNRKDFSNLIKGHGGVLDRLDSIIFVVLGFAFIFSFIR